MSLFRRFFSTRHEPENTSKAKESQEPDPRMTRLIHSLEEGDGNARAAAARALGDIRAADATSALVQRLLREGYAPSLTAIRESIKKHGDLALEPLLASLDTRIVGGPQQAITALGELGDKRAIEALASRLDHNDRRTTSLIEKALLQIGGPQATQILAAFHSQEPEDVKTRWVTKVESLVKSAAESAFPNHVAKVDMVGIAPTPNAQRVDSRGAAAVVNELETTKEFERTGRKWCRSFQHRSGPPLTKTFAALPVSARRRLIVASQREDDGPAGRAATPYGTDGLPRCRRPGHQPDQRRMRRINMLLPLVLLMEVAIASPAHSEDGWKLMGPPVTFRFDSDFDTAMKQSQDVSRRDASVDVKAEVSRWQPIATFVTHTDCVAAVSTMRELLNLSEDTYKVLQQESGALRTYEAFLLSLHHARCFSFAELRALGFNITPLGVMPPAPARRRQ